MMYMKKTEYVNVNGFSLESVSNKFTQIHWNLLKWTKIDSENSENHNQGLDAGVPRSHPRGHAGMGHSHSHMKSNIPS